MSTASMSRYTIGAGLNIIVVLCHTSVDNKFDAAKDYGSII